MNLLKRRSHFDLREPLAIVQLFKTKYVNEKVTNLIYLSCHWESYYAKLSSGMEYGLTADLLIRNWYATPRTQKPRQIPVRANDTISPVSAILKVTCWYAVEKILVEIFVKIRRIWALFDASPSWQRGSSSDILYNMNSSSRFLTTT